MGKIFDALEKSEKEYKKTATSKDSYADFSEAAEKQDTPGGGGDDKNLITLSNQSSFEAEQFRILRTNLLFPVSGKPPRTIMITSAVPGEGKSFVAANLSISIAQSINEHVLLMDCDLRKPSLKELFNLEGNHGLTDYLSNRVSISSLLQKTKIEKLTIFPAGNVANNPAELLSSDQMSHLLEEVKTRYKDRYVVIDSPPPQLAAEANAIARQVDGILLVVKYGSTRRELIEELIDILGKEKIIGIVINWFNIRSSTYYGYGKYSKYSKYYSK